MYRNFGKRAIDVALSMIALVVLSPILLLTALAVRLSSPGPVLFKQQRLGLHGKVFTIYKGQHWHNSKWEQFIVVHGHGLSRERNISTGETVEFEVSGDTIEAVYMIPGWTHNIINLSETENLVTVMTCNEIFNPNHPDTFFDPV